MAIERFEDIDAWKKARELSNEVYNLTYKGRFKKDFGLCDQIQRASVSIMSNIAEGFGCNSHNEFLQFLNYARRSSLEVQSHLYVALDRGYIGREEFNNVYHKALEVKMLINGFMRYLKGKNDKKK
jgi:four helix bundle protein